MADKTATQNLTRPQATDRVVDTWLYLKTLAIEADQRMTSHYADVDRVQNPPFCVMRLNAPQLLDLSSGSALVVFDTVDQDTANMADPSGQVMIPVETGFWLAGCHVQTTGLGSGTLADMEILFHTPEGDIGDNRRDGSIELASMEWSGVIRMIAGSDSFSVRVAYNGSAGSHGQATTVTFAEMYAVKLRDS